MIFSQTKLKGVFIIEPERIPDERGYFARTFCDEEFKARNLNPQIRQCNLSFNVKKGTLRGMHYQIVPHEEAKLIRCTRGAIYDVALDLRPNSPTFKKWIAVELTAEKQAMIYIPEGCAHGFQTLVEDTEVFYQISEIYAPEYARGVRWNDRAFAIAWPLGNPIISQRDSSFSDFA